MINEIITNFKAVNVGFAWILIDKDRRGWHDMMTGSKVVIKRKNFLFLGLLARVILLLVNMTATKATWDKVESNSRLYQEIIQDIGGELSLDKL